MKDAVLAFLYGVLLILAIVLPMVLLSALLIDMGI